MQAIVYTDGSCHTQLKIGAWVAIVFIGAGRHILSGTETGTTHNRMELTAVIEAINYVKSQPGVVTSISICTDSQYVTGLPARHSRLLAVNFERKAAGLITNARLVKQFFDCLQALAIDFVKVKAHQKKNETTNYNIEADLMCRKMLREAVGKDNL